MLKSVHNPVRTAPNKDNHVFPEIFGFLLTEVPACDFSKHIFAQIADSVCAGVGAVRVRHVPGELFWAVHGAGVRLSSMRLS
jgi:hypothetical protein